MSNYKMFPYGSIACLNPIKLEDKMNFIVVAHDLPHTQISKQARSPTPYSFGHQESVSLQSCTCTCMYIENAK